MYLCPITAPQNHAHSCGNILFQILLSLCLDACYVHDHLYNGWDVLWQIQRRCLMRGKKAQKPQCEEMIELNKLYKSNTWMKTGHQNGDDWQHNKKRPAVVSPLSARIVVWWLICTSGFSANHIYWLRFFRHCLRLFVFRRTSAHMWALIKRQEVKEGRRRKRTDPCENILSEDLKTAQAFYLTHSNEKLGLSVRAWLVSTCIHSVWRLSAALTCYVWDCGCTERSQLQDEGAEVCRVYQTLSGQLPAGCASFLCSLLRTLKKQQYNKSFEIMLECYTPLIVVFVFFKHSWIQMNVIIAK